jgi:hypothetical protein
MIIMTAICTSIRKDWEWMPFLSVPVCDNAWGLVTAVISKSVGNELTNRGTS